ncbi:hypothetical protein BGZ89_009155 [Linnemannia elongata]|nr:hypothetical protein BGZ89_009155 [Linnemannia elongata]
MAAKFNLHRLRQRENQNTSYISLPRMRNYPNKVSEQQPQDLECFDHCIRKNNTGTSQDLSISSIPLPGANSIPLTNSGTIYTGVNGCTDLTYLQGKDHY